VDKQTKDDMRKALDEINSRYDGMLQEYQESQAGPQASYEEYRDFVDQLERDRNKELDGEWLADQDAELQPLDIHWHCLKCNHKFSGETHCPECGEVNPIHQDYRPEGDPPLCCEHKTPLVFYGHDIDCEYDERTDKGIVTLTEQWLCERCHAVYNEDAVCYPDEDDSEGDYNYGLGQEH
jgi:hypothetical protein